MCVLTHLDFLAAPCHLQVPGSREPSAPRIEAYRLAALLNKHKFQRILQQALGNYPALQPLQDLVEQLHQLFFQASGTGVMYNMAVAPDDFIRVCEDQVARLKPQAG